MQKHWKEAFNYLAFLLVTTLVGGFQSSLWYQFFGYLPSPHIWLGVLAFWTLYRKIWEGAIMIYVISFVVASQSVVPFSLLLTIAVILFVLGLSIKQRVYWPGPTYFVLMTGLFAFLFPLFHYFLSFLVEENRITDFYFFRWLGQIILTAGSAWPLYYFLEWVDRKTQKEKLVETGSDFFSD